MLQKNALLSLPRCLSWAEKVWLPHGVPAKAGKGKQLERLGWAGIWKSNHLLDLDLGQQETGFSGFSP